MYVQTTRFEFVNFDDNSYVYNCKEVLAGLSAENFLWAFSGQHACLWHPLTTLTHMLDVEIYKDWAGGHHLTNVLLQTIAAMVMFIAIWKLIGDLWPAAFAAAVFAFHPLRVESVAWVAERKDVLSGLFFALTLLAYSGYARRPTLFRYVLVAIALALGLMSKATMVTTPFVLLLLDYWPLNRLRFGKVQSATNPSLGWLILEKLPLLALSAGASVATYLAQSGTAIVSVQQLPIGDRLTNAVFSYGMYLVDWIWPVNLAVHYPYPPGGPSPQQWVVAAVVLIAISVLAIGMRTSRPYYIVGWLWYLGMMVPTIGLVQAGLQARADRFTYLPQIGITIAVSMALADLAFAYRIPKRTLAILAGLLFVAMIAATALQVRVWQNSISLFRHAASCTKNNEKIIPALTIEYLSKGRLEEAIEQVRMWEIIAPNDTNAWKTHGLTLGLLKRYEEAAVHLKRFVEAVPGDVEGLIKYGDVLYQTSRRADGTLDEDKLAAAVRVLNQALAIEPDSAEAHLRLGFVLETQENYQEAIEHFRAALQNSPNSVAAHYHLGDCYYQIDKPSEAITALRKALELNPDDPEVLQLAAMIAATSEDAAARSGPDALRWISRVLAREGSGDPIMNLDILAAAYAECGQFTNAVAAAEQVFSLASAEAEQLRMQGADPKEIRRAAKWLAEIGNHLKLVRSGKPIRTVLAKK